MKMIDILIALAIVGATYPYFWILSFDPALRTFVRIKGTDGSYKTEMTFGVVPDILSPVPFAWTIGAFFVYVFSDSYCQVGDGIYSIETLVALAAATVIGRVIFSISSATRTTFHIGPDLRPHRPVELRVQDWLGSYIVSYFTTIVLKVLVFSLFLGIGWTIHKLTGFSGGPDTLLPLPIVLAWLLYYLGRIGRYYMEVSQHQNTAISLKASGSPWADWLQERVIKARWPIELQFVCLTLSFFPMYACVEYILRSCGWQGDRIPTVGVVAAGILGPLILDFMGLLVAAVASRR